MVGAKALPIYWFAGLLALSILPVLLAPMPAMVDYPNHLARMFLLSRDGGPDAHPFYEVAWAFYPNLAMDLTVPHLARFIGVESALRLFLLLAQLLVVSGSVAVEWAVKRRFELAGFAALLFLYSIPFAWGFVNFQFGLGLALWGIAAWLLLTRRPFAVRLAVHTGFVLVLAAAHFFTLGIYGFAIGMIELWAAWSRRAGVRHLLATFVLLALPALLVLGIMAGAGGSVGREGTEWLPGLKVKLLFSALNGYSMPFSAAGTALLVVFLYLLAKRGGLRLLHAGPWLAAGFALLYLAMPFKLLDTTFVDVRVVVAAALVLPAFTSVSLPEPRWRTRMAAAGLALMLANLAVVSWVWNSYRSHYAAIMESFGLLEPGSRILVGHSGEAANPPPSLYDYPGYHAPTLAVHFADAFVPSLFTSAGKQPVSARPAVRHLDIPWGGPVPVRRLKAIAEEPGSEGPLRTGTVPFIRNWERDFDYLYVLGAPGPNPLPDVLTRIDSGPRFVLYRLAAAERGP